MALSVVYLIFILSLVFIVRLGDADSITDLCQFTRSIDLCTQILNADPSSQETDTGGRANIMLNAAISNAADTSRYILDELVKTYSTDANAVRVVTECSTSYDNAKAALDKSISDLFSDDDLGYAQDEISAAASCADSCKNSFSNATPPLAYPDALAQRQKSFQDICGVANDIVEQFMLGD